MLSSANSRTILSVYRYFVPCNSDMAHTMYFVCNWNMLTSVPPELEVVSKAGEVVAARKVTSSPRMLT